MSSRPRGRRWLLIAALATAGVTAVAIVLGLRDGGPTAKVTAKPNTVVRIDPRSNRLVESYPVGRDPASVVATDRAVWVTSDYDSTLARVDLGKHSVTTVAGGVRASTLTRDSGGDIDALASEYPWFVWRLDPRTAKVVRHYTLPVYAVSGIAISGGSLWVTDPLANELHRFDLDGGHRADSVKVGAAPLLVTSGYGALWAEIAVARDPLVASGLSDVAVGAGSVWAVNHAEGTIVRINPRTNKIEARIQLPGGTAPRSVDIAGNAVWVTIGTPTATN